MKELDVEGNQITKLPVYSACSSLKKLNIAHNKLQSVDELVNCVNLEDLNISGNDDIQVCIYIYCKLYVESCVSICSFIINPCQNFEDALLKLWVQILSICEYGHFAAFPPFPIVAPLGPPFTTSKHSVTVSCNLNQRPFCIASEYSCGFTTYLLKCT